MGCSEAGEEVDLGGQLLGALGIKNIKQRWIFVFQQKLENIPHHKSFLGDFKLPEGRGHVFFHFVFLEPSRCLEWSRHPSHLLHSVPWEQAGSHRRSLLSAETPVADLSFILRCFTLDFPKAEPQVRTWVQAVCCGGDPKK